MSRTCDANFTIDSLELHELSRGYWSREKANVGHFEVEMVSLHLDTMIFIAKVYGYTAFIIVSCDVDSQE